MVTQQTAITKYVVADGINFAYRRFGHEGSVPLVFLQHFRGTMDHWDPALINPLAETRTIILIDNSGVGKSSGTVPDNFAAWAANIIAVLGALDIKEVDLLGFSMGGMAAQIVALNSPKGLVRRLILAGTGPSAGEGVQAGPEWAIQALAGANNNEEEEAAFIKTFYTESPEKIALGKEWWKRINERTEDRSDYVGPEGLKQQLKAAIAWGTPGVKGGSFERLHELNRIPVFIANGDNDVLVPTENSILMWRKIKSSHLHIYPDVGHGFLNEYTEMFAEHVRLFLDGEKVM